jgi:hypothetical protein
MRFVPHVQRGQPDAAVFQHVTQIERLRGERPVFLLSVQADLVPVKRDNVQSTVATEIAPCEST